MRFTFISILVQYLISLNLQSAINGFMSSGAFAVVVNEWVSVDSFFLIGDQRFENIGGDWRQFSGATLLSYLTLKELDRTKGGNIRFWGMFFIHRYIRFSSCCGATSAFWRLLQADRTVCNCGWTPRHPCQVLCYGNSVSCHWIWRQCMQRYMVIAFLNIVVSVYTNPLHPVAN